MQSIFKQKAVKRWKNKAEWIDGDGPFALLSHCRVLCVSLHETLKEAEKNKEWIDTYACGGGCHKKHEIINLG